MQQRYYEWFRRTCRMQEAMSRETEDFTSTKYRRMLRDLAHIYMLQGDTRQVNELAAQLTNQITGPWKDSIGLRDALLLAEIGNFNLFRNIEPLWQRRCFIFLEEMVDGAPRKGGITGQLRTLLKGKQLLSMLYRKNLEPDAEQLFEELKADCEGRFTHLGAFHAEIFCKSLEIRLLMEREQYAEADRCIGTALELLVEDKSQTAILAQLVRIYLLKLRMEICEHQQELREALEAHREYTAIWEQLSRDRNQAYTMFLQHQYDTRAQEQRILSLKRQNRRLSERADTDALTGLGNRQALLRQAECFVEAQKGSDVQLAVIMADVDFFKDYNDRYGHLQGDVVLRTVGRILHDYQEQGWTVFRYGGEEFLMLRRGTQLDTARGVAENILAALSRHAIPHAAGGEQGIVLMSLGVTSGLCSSLDEVKNLVAEADDALYHAKQSGRGCCRCFGEEGVQG